jgi:hypothetical protein
MLAYAHRRSKSVLNVMAQSFKKVVVRPSEERTEAGTDPGPTAQSSGCVVS